MIGVVLFDNHDDLLYVYNDEEFKSKMHSVSDHLDMSNSQDDVPTRREAESMILMQIFSPLLTSYRVMTHEFQNSYDCIACEDGSTVAFYEHMGFLLIAVAKSSVSAVHLARVCFSVMQHVCGPSLSVLKHSDTHSELTTLLVETFLKLRQSSQPVVTESLHYEPISEAVNSSILRVLQLAVEDLNERASIPENRTHILIIKETSIVAIYSGKGTSELKVEEILFLIIVANAFDHSRSSTRHSLIILESCVPYTIHIQRVENGIDVIILIEGGLNHISNGLYSLLKSVSSSKLDSIPKQLKQVKKMAQKLQQRSQWCDMLVWRPEQSQNQSAMSAFVRQILHGYEIVCLNPNLLFAAVEHVSSVIDEIQLSIPVQSLSQPCRLTPLLNIYPGLVHFVLIDRKNHRMISPKLSLDRRNDSTFENMWNIFHTSLEWLHEGMPTLLWNDKQLCYSHAIWIEDEANEKLPWNWDIQTGSLGYPALIGSGFYENLLKQGLEDEEVEPAHYLQMFCIHLSVTSPNSIVEQSKRLANYLKRFIYPSLGRLEDLF